MKVYLCGFWIMCGLFWVAAGIAYSQQVPRVIMIRKINLNTASATELVHSIRGIGIKRAQAIVQYRNTHGMFQSVLDLAKVRGLGKNFVKKHQLVIQQLYSVG